MIEPIASAALRETAGPSDRGSALAFALTLAQQPGAMQEIARARAGGMAWSRLSGDGAHEATLSLDGYHLMVSVPQAAAIRLRLNDAPPLTPAFAMLGQDGADPLTRTLFGEVANVIAPDGARQLGTHVLTDREIMRLARAPAGSTVHARASGPALIFLAAHPTLIPTGNMVTVVPGLNGFRAVLGGTFFTPGVAPPGTGTRAFALMAREAQRLGFSNIEACATREQLDIEALPHPITTNGYYSLPRWGFDGNLTNAQRRALPEGLAGTGTVLRLMATPEGRDWWREHGTTVDVDFDLFQGSLNQAALQRYTRETGVRLPAE